MGIIQGFHWCDQDFLRVRGYDLGNDVVAIFNRDPSVYPSGAWWDPAYDDSGWTTPYTHPFADILSLEYVGADPPAAAADRIPFIWGPNGEVIHLDGTGHTGLWPTNFGETITQQLCVGASGTAVGWRGTDPDRYVEIVTGVTVDPAIMARWDLHGPGFWSMGGSIAHVLPDSHGNNLPELQIRWDDDGIWRKTHSIQSGTSPNAGFASNARPNSTSTFSLRFANVSDFIGGIFSPRSFDGLDALLYADIPVPFAAEGLFRFYFDLPAGHISELQIFYYWSYGYNAAYYLSTGDFFSYFDPTGGAVNRYIYLNGQQVLPDIDPLLPNPDPKDYAVAGTNVLALHLGAPFGPVNLPTTPTIPGVIAPAYNSQPFQGWYIKWSVLTPYVSAPLDSPGPPSTTGVPLTDAFLNLPQMGPKVTEAQWTNVWDSVSWGHPPGSGYPYTFQTLLPTHTYPRPRVVQGFQAACDRIFSVTAYVSQYSSNPILTPIGTPYLDSFGLTYIWPTTGDIICSLYADDGTGYPGSVIASATTQMAVQPLHGTFTFQFGSPISVSRGDTYFWTFEVGPTPGAVVGSIIDDFTNGPFADAIGQIDFFSGASISSSAVDMTVVVTAGNRTGSGFGDTWLAGVTVFVVMQDADGNATAAVHLVYSELGNTPAYNPITFVQEVSAAINFPVPRHSNCEGLLAGDPVSFSLSIAPKTGAVSGTFTVEVITYDGPASTGCSYSNTYMDAVRPEFPFMGWDCYNSPPEEVVPSRYGFAEQNQRCWVELVGTLSTSSILVPAVAYLPGTAACTVVGANPAERVYKMAYSGSVGSSPGLLTMGPTGAMDTCETTSIAIGNGGRRDPNLGQWPLWAALSYWCNATPESQESGRYYNKPWDYFYSIYTTDSGIPMILASRGAVPVESGGTGHMTWGPVVAQSVYGPVEWPWTGETGITSFWGFGDHIGFYPGNPRVTQMLRRDDGQFFMFSNLMDEDVGTRLDRDGNEVTAGWSRCGFQILTSENPSAAFYSPLYYLPYASGQPRDISAIGMCFDSSNNAHFFFMDITDYNEAFRQAMYSVPEGQAVRVPQTACPIYHQAMRPDGTWGPLNTWDCGIGPGQAAMPTSHPSGGVAFPYQGGWTETIHSGSFVFNIPHYQYMNAVFSSDLTIAAPILVEELPLGPDAAGGSIPGFYSATPRLIYIGSTAFLFGIDGEAVRVARNTGGGWSGFREIISTLDVNGDTTQPRGIAVDWIPSRNQLGMLWSMRANGSFSELTLFQYFEDPGGYPDYTLLGHRPVPCARARGGPLGFAIG